ncbi:MAG: type 1 glutamine amidotransferase, partial [Deltaproteobacteria bacterium]|nr:type 1 glutamine amidotransferase [Deltaproteobacteria bacterium]
MRLQFLVHLPHETDHNITVWAEQRDHTVARTQVFKGDEFPSLDDFDWLMIMGGFQSAWEDEIYPWLTGEKRFILQALKHDKIVLGICFGAQLLAEVLGGRAFSNKHQEIGWHEVSLTPQGKKSFLFKKAPDPFRTFLWHSDHFSLPSGCASLAFSEASPHQAFISRTY